MPLVIFVVVKYINTLSIKNMPTETEEVGVKERKKC